MNYAWNWKVLFEDPYAGWLLSGLQATVLISLAAWAIALTIGLALGVLGSLPGRIGLLRGLLVTGPRFSNRERSGRPPR